MSNPVKPEPVINRLREGFDRIGFVLRADLWAAVGVAGLNPTQAQVLALLSRRPQGLRPKEIAAHLAVSAPSIADTLGALVRKGVVRRDADPSDARAVIMRITSNGLQLGENIAQAHSQIANALAALSPAALEEMLLTQIALIRQLQVAGAIPLQRMCVSCRHFRPRVHPDAEKPHHCAFVDSPLGGLDLRIDCGEHEATDPATEAIAWKSFTKGSSTLQVQPTS